MLLAWVAPGEDSLIGCLSVRPQGAIRVEGQLFKTFGASVNLILRFQSAKGPTQFLAHLCIQNGEKACKRCRRPVRGSSCFRGQDGRGWQLRRRCKFYFRLLNSHGRISLTRTLRTSTSSTSILSGSTLTPRLTSTVSSSCSANCLTSILSFLTYPRLRISYCRTRLSALLSRSTERATTLMPFSRRSI